LFVLVLGMEGHPCLHPNVCPCAAARGPGSIRDPSANPGVFGFGWTAKGPV
jgi:hypothetical protein